MSLCLREPGRKATRLAQADPREERHVLFELDEFAAYLQRAEFDTVTAAAAALVRDLVTTEVRLHVGATVYDAMTDVERAQFKGIALEAAKRALLNPSGIRTKSRSIDDFTESETYTFETLGGVALTEAERDRIDQLLGRQSGGAFSIRPAGQPDCPPWVAARRRYGTTHPG